MTTYIYAAAPGFLAKNPEPVGTRNLLSKLAPSGAPARELVNTKTSLEDIAAVVGMTACLRLSAWFGDGVGNAYVPQAAAEGQLLVKLIGLPAARALSAHWPGQHLAVPRLRDYEDDMRKKAISRMSERGFGAREIAAHLRISERRVQQICRELEAAGLLAVTLPPVRPRKPAAGRVQDLPPGFFGKAEQVAA